jgi:phosphoribosylformimino-5-aminoimidazole carboxamide ribotide isomerase
MVDKSKIELIPAIDIIGGKCVRLTKGDYNASQFYDLDPVSAALKFEEKGFKRLHIVDLDGARSKHVVNCEVLRKITRVTNLVVDFGGGVKTDEDIDMVFDNGADMAIVGSIAVETPELLFSWMEKYGSQRIILGADVRDGHIATNGWKQSSNDDLMPFIKRYMDRGICNVLCTDISRDGTLQGPSIKLYERIMSLYPSCHLIASGGVGCLNDIQSLATAGIPAVVFGKAIYEGKIDLDELVKWNNARRQN